MEISKHALITIVKAARLALRFADDLSAALYFKEKNVWTVPDEIAGELTDALFYMSGEKMGVDQEFSETLVMTLLRSHMSDKEVMDEILAGAHLHTRTEKQTEVLQPKPHLIDPEESRKLYEQNGGYMAPDAAKGTTPEGEWT